jgi:hypothetical protein
MKKAMFLMALAVLFSCNKDNSNDNSSTTIDGWKISEIDNVIAANNDISVSCDGNNKIHVCYCDDDNIKYATNKSGSWKKQTLATAEGNIMMMGYNDLATDGSNHVHIVYATETNEMSPQSIIYYATDKSGTMQTEPIYTVAGSISGMGIVATEDGKVHIIYSDPNFRLKYINNLAGSWSGIQDIGSYWTSVRPRMALDSDGNVYAAYEHGGEGVLRLQLINASGNLVSNNIVDGIVDSGNDIGWSPDIAINPSDNASYILYYNYTGEKMVFYNDGSISDVESSNWSDGNVALDPDGNPHILYSNGSKLRYGIWNGSTFDLADLPDVTNSRKNGLVMGSDGKAYIVYASSSTYTLRMMVK